MTPFQLCGFEKCNTARGDCQAHLDIPSPLWYSVRQATPHFSNLATKPPLLREEAPLLVSLMADRPGFVGIDTYLNLPRDKTTWLLKPLLPVSGAALLYGQEKSGKSAIAIQMAAAMCGAYDAWLGFPVVRTGPVLYLQLDNPRSTWAHRFEALKKGGLKYNEGLMLADRECLEIYPFDILQPSHMKYLHGLVQIHAPVAVFVDTLREINSGDENDSTISRNVIANLVGATHPAALVIISHSRKPNLDGHKDLMADHRGSSYITGRMDAILRMTKNRLYYGGRTIEEGSIKLMRQEVDGALMFEEDGEDGKVAMAKVLCDTKLVTLRSKARALATLLGLSEEAAMSRVRRVTSADKDLLLNELGVNGENQAGV